METVTLRPITPSDTDDIVRWRNSDAVRLNMHDQRMINTEQHRDYYKKQILTGKTVLYIILADRLAIGTVYYKFLNKEQVELGIFIGETEYIGKGYGCVSFEKLLQNTHNNVEIKQLLVKVSNSNIRAINLYSSFGFEKIESMNDRFIIMKKENNNEI